MLALVLLVWSAHAAAEQCGSEDSVCLLQLKSPAKADLLQDKLTADSAEPECAAACAELEGQDHHCDKSTQCTERCQDIHSEDCLRCAVETGCEECLECYRKADKSSTMSLLQQKGEVHSVTDDDFLVDADDDDEDDEEDEDEDDEDDMEVDEDMEDEDEDDLEDEDEDEVDGEHGQILLEEDDKEDEDMEDDDEEDEDADPFDDAHDPDDLDEDEDEELGMLEEGEEVYSDEFDEDEQEDDAQDEDEDDYGGYDHDEDVETA